MMDIQLNKDLKVFCQDDGIESIELKLPASIEFKPALIGRGVFAKHSFRKDAVMYDAVSVLIPNREQSISLSLIGNSELTLNTFTHAVELSESVRELFPYDSFMNHSCDANSFMRYTGKVEHRLVTSDGIETGILRCHTYQMVALRDIETGEEITCNYNWFDYRCHGHEIDCCCCGTTDCCGRVGFAYLPFEKQVALLPSVTETIQERFYHDHSDYEAGALAVKFAFESKEVGDEHSSVSSNEMAME